ncbi:MAG: alpha-2-macroglobulin family protein [Myxococcota bacterium]
MKKLLCICLLGLVASAGCKSDKTDDKIKTARETEVGDVQIESSEEGLIYSLESGTEQPDDGSAIARNVDGKELSKQQIESLLSRLPDLPDDSGEASFAMRKKSLKPPTTGEKIDTAFPADGDAARPDAEETTKEFRVRRYAPEGDVKLARQVSLTFSAPVVDVTSQTEASKTAPATIEPAVEGTWRWVGTKTALFVPEEGRFPMATDYEVATDEDLESANGEPLEEGASFAFSTPTLKLEQHWPTGSGHDLQPTLFLGFNQRIDAEQLQQHIFLRADGQDYEIELVDELPDDSKVPNQYVDRFDEDRRVFFRPAKPLPRDTSVTFGIAEGSPSAEGPKTTPSDQKQGFRTFAPLVISRQSCESEQRSCAPNQRWWLSFNNALDQEAFEQSQVTVTPEAPNLEAQISGSSMQIVGDFEANTVYELTVSADLEDVRGQTLGTDETRKFHVGPMPPMLTTGLGPMAILDPDGDKSIRVTTANVETLDVQINRVGPGDWNTFQNAMQSRGRNEPEMPGETVLEETFDVEEPGNTLRDTKIELAEHLNNGHGQFLVSVGVGKYTKAAEKRYNRRRHRKPTRISWVQVTDLGVDAFVDRDDMLVWTTDLSSGDAKSGVEVSLTDQSESTTSEESGLTRFELPGQPKNNETRVLVAKTDDDLAIVPENTSYWARGTSWSKNIGDTDRHIFHTFDDRGMYRPGETIELKGWLRHWEVDDSPRLSIIGAGKDATFTFYDSRGAKLGEVEGQISETGGFHTSFELPDNANLGHARVDISIGSSIQGNHSFQIQEFRTPEFEVSVKSPPGPHMIGDTVPLTTTASYYAGGPLAGSDGSWRVTSNSTNYRPPNWDEFSFGHWTPWWYWGGPSTPSQSPKTLDFTTNPSGEHQLDVKLHDANPAVPMSVNANASVTDVNGQTWSSNTNFIVHPSSLYVGLKSSTNFVKKGESFRIDAVTTTLEGEAVSERMVAIEAERKQWKFEDGEWQQVVVETQACELESSDAPETCKFEAKDSGQYVVTATVVDDRNRESESRIYVWVAGEQPRPPKRVEMQKLRMIPDSEDYATGETAELLVQSPIENGQGLLTIEQGGLTRTERFAVKDGSATIEVDISEDDIPNINIFAEVAGSAPRVDNHGEPVEDAPSRPAIATGQIDLPVKWDTRALDLEISPDSDVVTPGSKTSIEVAVTNAKGEPIADTEVALVVVDEAILALSGYTLPDPLDSFYPSIPSYVRKHHNRPWVTLQEAQKLAEMEQAQAEGEEASRGLGGAGYGRGAGSMAKSAAPSSGMDMMMAEAAPMEEPAAPRASQGPAIDLRTDFRALALFEPALRTDGDGKVSVDFEMPDNLTQYRIMAVAAHEATDFGKSESQITARLPLMVRPSPPRFLNYGDDLELRVVVQNPGDKEASVQLAARANNLALDDPAGRAFSVPAGDRVEVRLPAKTHKAGESTVQFAVASGAWGDAAEVSFPVWTPATTEAFATYGTIDKGAISQPVSMPPEVIEEYGALKLSTSSTALQALTDAFIYLIDYPYECAEQTASRIISAAALAPVLDAFDAEGLPDKDELDEKMQAWVDRLLKLQRGDGGFGLWRYNGRDYPYASVHAIHALYRAEAFGAEIPKQAMQRAQNYLDSIERHIPAIYSERARTTIQAYAYYVSDVGGKSQHHVSKAIALAKKKPEKPLTLEAIGWLMSTLEDEPKAKGRLNKFERFIMNRASETASTAQFTVDYGDQGYVVMHSSRRVDAVLLESMIRRTPKHDLIPKIARGLLDHRKRGRWGNTQENVFVLLALKEYFDAYESQTPDFVARAWLGDDYAAEHTYKGRSTDTKMVDIPLTMVKERAGDDGKTNLVLQKDGKGRLYYRIGMTYAPASLELDPAEYGFTVVREYEAVDQDSDVEQLDDGTWKIKLGARVRVRLQMVAPERRYHVALVDKMPGGFESLNPALAVTEPIPTDDNAQKKTGHYWWWWRPWYEHQNMRTERTEAFASLVWPGVHEYSYVARATTPGTFVVPPAKAEEMYHPETFGRTGTTRVVIED